jgi:hypothetical protein
MGIIAKKEKNYFFFSLADGAAFCAVGWNTQLFHRLSRAICGVNDPYFLGFNGSG